MEYDNDLLYSSIPHFFELILLVGASTENIEETNTGILFYQIICDYQANQ